MADLTSNEYKQVIDLISKYYGTSSSDIISELNQYSDNIQNPSDLFGMLPEHYKIIYNADGSIRNYTAVDTAVSALSSEQQVASEINSNVGSTLVKEATKVNYQIPIQTATETAETATKTTFSTVAGTAGNIVFGKVLPAVAAVSAGITLGKVIDKAIYEVGTNIFDADNLEAFNPDTWKTITADDDSLGAKVFNTIFGIDPNTGKTQQYMDENAFAYMALWLNSIGAFNKSGSIIKESDETTELGLKYKLPIEITKSGSYDYITTDLQAHGYVWGKLIAPSADGVYAFFTDLDMSNPPSSISHNYTENYIFASKTKDATTKLTLLDVRDGSVWNTTNMKASDKFTHNGKTVYFQALISAGFAKFPNHPTVSYSDDYKKIAWLMLYGATEQSSIEGMGNQNDAKLPTITGTTPADVLAELKEQYPDLWNNAISETVVQPDGSTKTYTYVPVATPNFNPTNENQPTSGSSTQADPAVDPNTMPADSLAELIKVFTSTPTDTKDDTGDGKTPVVIPPTGSANALFAIYNPTEAQIKSFGAWLWSPNFIDQLKKMFNDPAEAIIGLHKVFVTPITGAEQNIKVGYLDSGVASKIVTNQYVTIDCGTITLAEFFGNVFDYSPFTDISLYLPFIGIVKLNNADVLRSSINIIYHADVINGSVLAEVKVNRDGAGGTLYQYTGNCAVEYPLSNGSYMGMITGALSLTVGVATAVATKGVVPALLGAGAGLGRMHNDVERSGGFAGNAGAMGIKKPYLIISRPQTELADKFTTFVGKPSNYTTTIGACKGFTKVDTVHIENVDATSSELDELNQILTNGILV